MSTAAIAATACIAPGATSGSCAAFDIRQFHATGLNAGSTGLDVLERACREQGLI